MCGWRCVAVVLGWTMMARRGAMALSRGYSGWVRQPARCFSSHWSVGTARKRRLCSHMLGEQPAVHARQPKQAWEWNNVQDFDLSGRKLSSDATSALIVLNTDCVGPMFKRMWDVASLHICADGGANRLFDGLDTSELTTYVPHYIKGDLDSLREDVACYYRSKGTRVVKDPDQDTNDLQKCLDIVLEGGGDRTLSPLDCNVWVLGALGLRFDHNMANLHMLYTYERSFRRLVLVGQESLAFLLPPGKHIIRPDASIEGPVCGLIPLARPCHSVKTTGLRWNLDGQRLEFGGLVSTSNEFEKDEQGTVITVETTDPLVWTSVIRPELRPVVIRCDD